MVTIKILNPIHNQFEPLTASMKKNKIAFGSGRSKRELVFGFGSLVFDLCA